jgi:hypothetical protein
MTPESQVKSKISKRLDAEGSKVWYFMPFQGGFGFKGVPDYVGCRRGAFFSIEAKAKGKKPTALQDMCMDNIFVAHGVPFVIAGTDVNDPEWQRLERFLTTGEHGA